MHETISLILYLVLLQLCIGFVPMATESRLAPVPGPVPHSYPVNKELQLPEAFTSTSTHFTPIILTNEADSEENSHNIGLASEGWAIWANSVYYVQDIYKMNPDQGKWP